MIVEEKGFLEFYDAIIGLAYPGLSAMNSTPLFDSMMQQNLIAQNVFAFFLSVDDTEESELIFGWIDHTKYTGDLQWYPVVYKSFWTLKLDDIKVNIFKQDIKLI